MTEPTTIEQALKMISPGKWAQHGDICVRGTGTAREWNIHAVRGGEACLILGEDERTIFAHDMRDGTPVDVLRTACALRAAAEAFEREMNK